jgi:hypothetical protein
MERDQPTTERLKTLIARIAALTNSGELHWERQQGSAHRYARWNNNLLILGPADVDEPGVPRYLFITPFDSPDCVEANSNDPVLGSAIAALFDAVDAATKNQPAIDPFAINSAVLDRLIT